MNKPITFHAILPTLLTLFEVGECINFGFQNKHRITGFRATYKLYGKLQASKLHRAHCITYRMRIFEGEAFFYLNYVCSIGRCTLIELLENVLFRLLKNSHSLFHIDTFILLRLFLDKHE